VVSPTLPFPLSLPSPFPFPLSFQTNQWEGMSDPVRGEFPGFPPTNTTLVTMTSNPILSSGSLRIQDHSQTLTLSLLSKQLSSQKNFSRPQLLTLIILHTHTHTQRDYRHRMNCLYLARTNHHSVTQIALSRRMRSNGQIVKGLHRVILIIRDGRLSAAAARDAICIT